MILRISRADNSSELIQLSVSVLVSPSDAGIIRNDFYSLFFVVSSSIQPSSTESIVQCKYDTLNPLLFL